MTTNATKRENFRYDHAAMIRGANGANRIGPQALKERLAMGHQMNVILKEEYKKAIQSGKDEAVAGKLARRHRDQYAQEKDISPKYITDFQAIAERFGPDRWDQDLASQAYWKLLQVFAQKKMDEEYARRFILLHIHGLHDPECPNTITGSVSELEEYKHATEEQVAEVNAKYAALIEEQAESEEDIIIQQQQADEAVRNAVIRLLPTLHSPEQGGLEYQQQITSTLQEEVDKKESTIQYLSHEMNDLEKTLEHVQETSLKKDQQAEILRSEIRDLQNGFEYWQKQAEENATRANNVQQENITLGNLVKELQENADASQENALAMLKKVQQLEEEIADLKIDHDIDRLKVVLQSKEDTDKAYRQLATNLSQANRKIEELQQQLSIKSGTLDALYEQNAVLRQNLNELKQYERQISNANKENVAQVKKNLLNLAAMIQKMVEDSF